VKKLIRLLLWAMVASNLISPTPATASAPLDQATLTVCTSLKTGYQLISKTGKCNERIYEARTWFQKGSAPSGTPGSKLIDLTTCISKSSLIPFIRTRSTCNSITTTTAVWQRPLGPPVAPSITSVAMGLLGTATLNINAPTEDGGVKITSYLVTSSPGAIAATYTPVQIKAAKITGLTPGSSYSFSVVAINIKGPSPSSIASAPSLAPTLPSAPSITQVVATSTNSAQLTFTAPLDNGGSPITSFIATSNPGSLQTAVYQSAGGTINITNLSHSTTYTFSLKAINAAGSSLPSVISPSITTATPPPPPEPLAVAPALAAPAFTLSSAAETRTVNTVATGFTTTSTGGAIASFAINATPPGMSFNTTTGALTGTPNTFAAATNYTITATNASGSATQTFRLTVAAVVYTVGQTGPGGGTVFYVATTSFSCGPTLAATCTYLEAAPSGWNTGADPSLTWATNVNNNRTTTVPAPGAIQTAIGTGYQNSNAIVAQTGNVAASSAAVAARAYRGSGLTDWYLPSRDELNQMCKWARGITGDALTTLATVCTGGTSNSGSSATGFVDNRYWSSTEFARNSSEESIARGQNFGSGSQDDLEKSDIFFVRPVRAF
jgi:hypothetical protein